MLGAVPAEYVKVAVRYNVIMTAYSIDWLREVVKVMKGQMGQPIRFHLKIDSGMNRLGVKTIEQVSEVKSLSTIILFTAGRRIYSLCHSG